ncbi:hypothetical protein [Albibacterium bauzanense]|uniref:Guanylate cyclase domain-containing protein n=1 Tax=Albibacterium bauzanense TaxID=653929 RepID=A0A4R1M6X7_9SPHI|nr:hypothetical protein [Albibacterium bauzanense]TCK85549.1 hypothetical protein C8N28_0860 [Albibacterium bauzanense]
MEEKITKTNWVPTANRFVCFLDIMGFKDLVMRNNHKYIYELLLDLSKNRETLDNVKSLPERYDLDSLKTVSFSDSIVIFTKTDSVECFELLTISVNWLFAQAIKSEIAMKGSIALGETSVNIAKQIFFGQSIIDAYLLQEEVAFYGIVAHNSVENFIANEGIDESVFNTYKECKAPLKSGKIGHLILNWADAFDREEGIDLKENVLLVIQKLRNKTSGSPRRYIDNTIGVINEIYKSSLDNK